MSHVISVCGLTHRFGDVLAVDNIDLEVPEGICFGLLGPNGAGKTTTIEIMEGIRSPTAGRVFFRGEPLTDRYRDRVGIQFQQTALQEHLTVEDTIRVFGRLYSRTRDMDEIVALCDLEDLLKRDNRKLSGGQRQRMLLAIALINDPDLLFLDEPTTGLDPQARRNFWALIRKVRAENTTVVLTTHYMDEAEELCDEIAIMDRGTIIAQGTPPQLLDRHFHGIIVRIPRPESPASIADARMYDDHIDIPTSHVDQTVRELTAAGVSLEGLSIHRPNLDDLFLQLTGSSLRA